MRVPSAVTASRPGVVVTQAVAPDGPGVHPQFTVHRYEDGVAAVPGRAIAVEGDVQFAVQYQENLLPVRSMGEPPQIGRDRQLPRV